MNNDTWVSLAQKGDCGDVRLTGKGYNQRTHNFEVLFEISATAANPAVKMVADCDDPSCSIFLATRNPYHEKFIEAGEFLYVFDANWRHLDTRQKSA